MKESVKNIIQEEELKELEYFFKIASLPAEPIALDNCSQIIDAPLFVSSHLNILKAKKGTKRYLPDLARLKQLKHIINQKINDNGNQ